jgi:16S rRNA (adenine1518-N6/adenine1519-N6)-dimethyltransferase
MYFKVVKMAFNQRRKTLRNALSAYLQKPEVKEMPIFNKRAEQLSFKEFEHLVEIIISQYEQTGESADS